jgi:predicted nucleic acid-binding protein
LYLVDTNVVSAVAPSVRAATVSLSAWMDARSSDLFLSAVTIAEIGDGIAKLRRERASRRAANLERWLLTLLHLYGDRVLAFDAETARVAGVLSDKVRGLGHTAALADIIIGATAAHHGLTLLTRNTKDFVNFGIATHDPFVSLPS